MIRDFGLMALLFLAAQLLRGRLRLLQWMYLPTAILAGFLGLAGGEQGLNLIPFHHNADGRLALASYPTMLVDVLFATVLLGFRPRVPGPREAVRKAGDTFFYNLASEFGQYAVAMLAGLTLLGAVFPELNASYSILMPAGFVGGHGTVAAMGQVLNDHGFEDALTVGFTFATVGLLAGVLGGLLAINLATRRGWTRLVQAPDQLPQGMRTGFLRDMEQSNFGRETTSPIALETLTWHLAVVFSAVVLADLTNELCRSVLPDSVRLPQFALAMLFGALLQFTLGLAGVDESINRQLTERIGSTAADFLVAFGIASISIRIVIAHAAPLFVMSAAGVLFSAAFLRFAGPRVFRNFWFERSVFVYGWNTGVVGTGVALLRVVDPRFRSKTLEDFGMAYLVMSLISVGIIVLLPQLTVRGYVTAPTVTFAAGTIICLLASKRMFGWNNRPLSAIRDGEQAVLDEDRRASALEPRE